MSEKRKKVVLTIRQKIELIDKFDSGYSAAKLSETYNIGIQTVRDIYKNKRKLEEFTRSCDSGAGPSERKSMKSSSYESLDTALLLWFNQKRAEGIPVSGPMCSCKAKIFYDQLGLEGNFNASSGWLTRFKQRHGIREITVQGERLSANSKAGDVFCKEFRQYIDKENLQIDQIFNADETGLYWKCLPTKTLAFTKERSAPGHKSSKERLTVMCCANASGSYK